MTTALPCPFCNSTDVVARTSAARTRVVCNDCFAFGPIVTVHPPCTTLEDYAVVKWNERGKCLVVNEDM